jgi:hypothetical protein
MPPLDLVPRLQGFLVGFLTGFLPGLLSGYILLNLTDRRKALRDRSRQIYVPLHDQLFRALKQVEEFDRPLAIDLNFWKSLEASGLSNGVRASLRKKISHLYAYVLPEFESAWMALNESDGSSHGMRELLVRYEEKLGVECPPTPGERFTPWWRFLLTREFQPALLNVSDFARIRIWNKYLIEDELSKKGLKPVTILQEIWTEAQSSPAIRRLQAAREIVLVEIPPSLKKVSKLIQA